MIVLFKKKFYCKLFVNLILKVLSTPNLNNNQLFNNNNNNFVSSQQFNNAINNNALGTTNVNGVGTLLTVNQAQTLNQDQYGTPQGNVITGTNIGGTSSNINNFGRGNVDPGLTNSVSASLTFPTASPNFNNGNNNNLNTFNNVNNLRTINQQSPNNPFLSNSINNNNNFGYV